MKILDLKQQEQRLHRQGLQLQQIGQAGANRASGHSGVTFFTRDCEDGIYQDSENCSKHYCLNFTVLFSDL